MNDPKNDTNPDIPDQRAILEIPLDETPLPDVEVSKGEHVSGDAEVDTP